MNQEFTVKGHTSHSDASATGNIYADRFRDQGERFTDYQIDCAACGATEGLFGVSRHRKAKTVARAQGWTTKRQYGLLKWHCPKCSAPAPKPSG